MEHVGSRCQCHYTGPKTRKQKQHVFETILSDQPPGYRALPTFEKAAHRDQHVAGDVANDEGQAKPNALGTHPRRLTVKAPEKLMVASSRDICRNLHPDRPFFQRRWPPVSFREGQNESET